VTPPELPAFLGQYRFSFHPVRYTSLGLSVCEAMMVGLPVVGLATTELPTIITDGVDGFVSNDLDRLVDVMRTLLDDPDLAARVGAAARDTALRRFSLARFTADWEALLSSVADSSR
jgi:glycosyltransferase involved in cell wall biosynthesis